MDVINIGTLADIHIAVPPLDEQLRIVAEVADKSNRFELLAKEAETAIALLQERRAALISAAVTGKIDVCSLSLHAEEVAA
ncbi:restriction endonuclease subunit S [Rubrivivax rivuli]|uniref:Restriction endonuclease subunit S n=1 Tax=Rubrivivax rivuli TaxID=1862385 RepID=A0A437RGT7_9BURK|nr:restriction endonuclease subunit S [Rubrivivax rivuli]RVU45948.1 restriction endonuclease subunit S [Rubrivivax rivuli]